MVPPSTLVLGMPLGTLIWGAGSLVVILYLAKTKALTKNCIGSALVIFLGPVAMITIVIMYLTKYFYQKKYGPNTVPKWLVAKA